MNKKEWARYTENLSLNFSALKKITKLNFSELTIAYKYCNLTQRTSQIASQAAQRLHDRLIVRRNFNSNDPPSKNSQEYKRRIEIIENSIIYKINLEKSKSSSNIGNTESCSVCLAEFSKNNLISLTDKNGNQTEKLHKKMKLSENSSLQFYEKTFHGMTTRTRKNSKKETKKEKNPSSSSKIENICGNDKLGDSTITICEKVQEICCLKTCNHVFHTECIKNWLLIKMACPICRQSIDLENDTIFQSQDDM